MHRPEVEGSMAVIPAPRWSHCRSTRGRPPPSTCAIDAKEHRDARDNRHCRHSRQSRLPADVLRARLESTDPKIGRVRTWRSRMSASFHPGQPTLGRSRNQSTSTACTYHASDEDLLPSPAPVQPAHADLRSAKVLRGSYDLCRLSVSSASAATTGRA
jgi:hypothetical protein